jgi:hypothetical protein
MASSRSRWDSEVVESIDRERRRTCDGLLAGIVSPS